MAQATVTLKVTPHELQIIKEALRLYAHEVKYLGRKEEREPLKITIVDDDPRVSVLMAQSIIQGIGLK